MRRYFLARKYLVLGPAVLASSRNKHQKSFIVNFSILNGGKIKIRMVACCASFVFIFNNICKVLLNFNILNGEKIKNGDLLCKLQYTNYQPVLLKQSCSRLSFPLARLWRDKLEIYKLKSFLKRKLPSANYQLPITIFIILNFLDGGKYFWYISSWLVFFESKIKSIYKNIFGSA